MRGKGRKKLWHICISSLKDEDIAKLKALAKQEHRSISNFVTHILLEYLKKHKRRFVGGGEEERDELIG